MWAWLTRRKKKMKILVVGLDNSGKTTILNYMAKATHEAAVPTVGYRSTTFTMGNIAFESMDMAGAARYRGLWAQAAQDTQAITFVIDASDKLRLAVTAGELEQLLADLGPTHKAVPVVVLANKMDLPSAMDPPTIAAELELDRILSKHSWHIAATNGLTGEGLAQAFGWLSDQLRQAK